MSAVFTIDTLLALALTFMILSISLSMMSEFKYDSDERLLYLGRDMLSVLEEKEILTQLVNTQTTDYDYISSSIGPQYCMDMSIYNSQGVLIFNNVGCSKTKVQSYRSFTFNDQQYIAKLR